jgi:putative membrane protein
MSADRTLMSVIRTALSLIGFGFTIFQVFHHLVDTKMLANALAPRNFGIALVLIGIGMLASGIAYHLVFIGGLRRERAQLARDGLIHAQSVFPLSATLLVALLLLALGLRAIVEMVS